MTSPEIFWKLQENVITDANLEILVDYLRNAQRFTQHNKVRQFEAAYSAWQGCANSVFVNSGSSANMLLLQAVKEMRGWGPETEILVPALTWPTTVTPVMQAGLRPVFVDANLDDLSMDYDDLAAKVTSRTKGVFVAHILGFPSDIGKIRDALANDAVILEDSCESMGATIGGRKVGNLGIGSTFSFYWGHHMTTVEGGMICTDDEDLYKLLVLKRSHGLARELPARFHAEIRDQHPDLDFSFLFLTDGYNVRSTEFNAVLGLEQLKALDIFVAKRNSNYRRFVEICRAYEDHFAILEKEGISSFALPFICRDSALKNRLQGFLSKHGVETRPLISGNLLRQPFLRQLHPGCQLPTADFVHTNAFYIGNNQFVDDERLDALRGLLDAFFRAEHPDSRELQAGSASGAGSATSTRRQ